MGVGVCERLCPERIGLSDERGAGNCQEFYSEDSSPSIVGEKDRSVPARRGSDAGEFQSIT